MGRRSAIAFVVLALGCGGQQVAPAGEEGGNEQSGGDDGNGDGTERTCVDDSDCLDGTCAGDTCRCEGWEVELPSNRDFDWTNLAAHPDGGMVAGGRFWSVLDPEGLMEERSDLAFLRFGPGGVEDDGFVYGDEILQDELLRFAVRPDGSVLAHARQFVEDHDTTHYWASFDGAGELDNKRTPAPGSIGTVTQDGSVLVVMEDGGLVKEAAGGDQLWEFELEGYTQVFTNDVAVLDDGSIAVVGTDLPEEFPPEGCPHQGLLWVLTADGELLWSREIGPTRSWSWSVAADGEGGMVVASGQGSGACSASEELWVTRLDAEGDPRWEHVIPPWDGAEASLLSLVVDPNGGVFVAGNSGTQRVIHRVDAQGVVATLQLDRWIAGMAAAPSGGVYFAEEVFWAGADAEGPGVRARAGLWCGD